LVLDTNALSKSKSYQFDVAGNLTRTVDRNGRMIQYVFDTLDRHTQEKWQQGGSATPTLTVATCYGPNCGRIFGRIETVEI
jgi:YD repeat-containing protein